MPPCLKQAAPAASASPYPPFIDFLPTWDEDPSFLDSRPQRRSIFATFLPFLLPELRATSLAVLALGDRLIVGSSCKGQSAVGSEEAEDQIEFARHEKFDYLTLLERLKVAASCRCARRSRHPRGMPLRGGCHRGPGG